MPDTVVIFARSTPSVRWQVKRHVTVLAWCGWISPRGELHSPAAAFVSIELDTSPLWSRIGVDRRWQVSKTGLRVAR